MKTYTCISEVYPFNNDRMSSEYGKFLNGMEWSFFATLTTRFKLTQKSGRSMMERVFEKLNKEYRNDVGISYTLETYGWKAGYHIHALIRVNRAEAISMVGEEERIRLLFNCKYRKDRTLTLYPYDYKLGASHYIMKYIGSNHTDYDFLGEYKRRIPESE
jgi:hypothetical protein